MNASMPVLYAHRGAHRDHPENTPGAFAAAADDGADGIELDVRPCATGEVVVAHDRTLERVAGRPEAIEALSWQRLRGVDVGRERVPLLDEVLDLAASRGLRVNVEVKGDVPDRVAAARAVARVLARRPAAEREAYVLSTFDPVVLGVLRLFARSVPVGYLFDAAHTGVHRAAIVVGGLRPGGVHPHAPLCTAARVRRWRRRGRFVNVWTVNAPAEARRLAALGVDGLISDDVPGIRRELRAAAR